jgi:hypothetical protein
MLFVTHSLLVALATVFVLNILVAWLGHREHGIASYLFATWVAACLALLGLVGKQPLDRETRWFLVRWIVIVVATFYLIIWGWCEGLSPKMRA